MIRLVRSKSQTRQGSSLAEVARAAGVSIATASRVLNGENKELWAGAAARAEKIRQAAKRLGYQPDWRARALRISRTNTIGIVYSETLPMMDMTSYALMFRSFGAVLQAAGYHMMFVHVPRTTGVQPASMLQAMDAAVFYHNITEGELEAARAVRGPSILINCEPKLPYPRVDADEVGGATALTQHLLALGHRRIVFYDRGPLNAEWMHFSRITREQVVRQIISTTGDGKGFSAWQEDYSISQAQTVTRFLAMPKPERPTAIVASYSIDAIGLLNAFVQQGVKVPEELSIATFDDHQLVSNAIVPLTTVKVPMEEIGRTAAGLILGLLQEPKRRPSQAIQLPESLVVRQSTGPAPR